MAITRPGRATILALALAIGIATVAIHQLWAINGPTRLVGGDIYNVWEEGTRLATGTNPYARIIGKSLRENDNYPTYLPLSYLFVALLHRLGIQQFPDFLAVWRALSLACHLGIGVLTFQTYRSRSMPFLGLIACTVLLFGRWSAYIIDVQHLEFIALLPLLIAGHQLKRRPILSALLFGLSLCVKQIGILVLPCFLLALHSESTTDKPARSIQPWKYGLLALLPPLLICLPFLIDYGTGFVLSMFFSASREFSDHGIATGSRLILLDLDSTRYFMAALLAANWLAQAKEKVNFWLASSITLLIFLQFNPVIFGQYYIWFNSFFLITAAFLLPARRAPVSVSD